MIQPACDPDDIPPPGLEALAPDRAALARRLCAFIDYWHFETFYGSELANSTDLWNLVHCAKEDLKARIVAHI